MVAQPYTGPERRVHQRLRRSFLLQYRLWDKDEAHPLAAGNAWAHDLSAHGMRLHTLGPLPCPPSRLLQKDGTVHLACQIAGIEGSDTWLRGTPAWVANPVPSEGAAADQIGRASCRERV